MTEDLEKILVVDNDVAVCKFCVNGLKSKGYHAIFTTKAKRVLEIIRLDSIDLVLTNANMPDANDLDLLQQLRMISPDTSIIVMSAFTSTEAAINAVNNGAYGFIAKPFHVDEMILAVRNALEKRKLIKEIIRLQTLVNLFKVTENINSSLEISKLLNTMISAVVNETKSEKAVFFYPDEETNELYVRYVVGVDKEEIDQIRIPICKDVLSNIFKYESRQQLNDNNSSDAFNSCQLQELLGKDMLAIPMQSKHKILGLLGIFKNGKTGGFSESDREIASILTSQASIALDHAELMLDHEILFLESLKSLARILDERDPYTHGHSHRVSRLAVLVAQGMNLPEEKIEELAHSGILHDIGKIGIRDEILLKPGSLTREEYEIIKTHPEKGYKILKPIKKLSNVVDAVYTHHEWFNGKGYPRGLKGDDIPLAGSIIAVVDAYDTITTDRIYRRRRSHDEALKILERFSGTQFHPEVVKVITSILPSRNSYFLKMIPEVESNVN